MQMNDKYLVDADRSADVNADGEFILSILEESILLDMRKTESERKHRQQHSLCAFGARTTRAAVALLSQSTHNFYAEKLQFKEQLLIEQKSASGCELAKQKSVRCSPVMRHRNWQCPKVVHFFCRTLAQYYQFYLFFSLLCLRQSDYTLCVVCTVLWVRPLRRRRRRSRVLCLTPTLCYATIATAAAASISQSQLLSTAVLLQCKPKTLNHSSVYLNLHTISNNYYHLVYKQINSSQENSNRHYLFVAN